jgi:TolB-like protein
MLLASLCLASVAATPSIAVGDLSRVNVTPELGTFAEDLLGQALGTHGLKVVSKADLQALLGLERQKQLFGCAEGASSCTAEFVQALGVDALVTGTVARLGATLQVNLRALDARTGAVRGRWSGSIQDDADLPGLLTRAGDALAEGLSPATGPQASASAAARGSPASWALLGAGVLVAAGGGACLVLEEQAHVSLGAPSSQGVLSSATATATRDRGKLLQVAGPTLLGVGAAAIASGAVLRLVQTGPAPAVSAVVTPSGVAVVLSGGF